MTEFPVRILDFKASRQSPCVTLNLKITDLEAGTRVFIERSLDGSSWIVLDEETIIETVRLHISQHYDQTPPADPCFYRMGVKGNNTAIVYSRMVSLPSADIAALSVSPNPAVNMVTITAQHPAFICIYNPDGSQVFKGEVSTQGRLRVDITAFAPGIYLIWTNRGWTRFTKI